MQEEFQKVQKEFMRVYIVAGEELKVETSSGSVTVEISEGCSSEVGVLVVVQEVRGEPRPLGSYSVEELVELTLEYSRGRQKRQTDQAGVYIAANISRGKGRERGPSALLAGVCLQVQYLHLNWGMAWSMAGTPTTHWRWTPSTEWAWWVCHPLTASQTPLPLHLTSVSLYLSAERFDSRVFFLL